MRELGRKVEDKNKAEMNGNCLEIVDQIANKQLVWNLENLFKSNVYKYKRKKIKGGIGNESKR